MAVFDLISLPFCRVLVVGEWNPPAQRFFAAYQTRQNFRWLLGHAVVDEFATFSSPIFLAPQALLGKIYNAGLSLGHQRDHEMAVDLGWPPLCVGLDEPAPALPTDWEEQLLTAIQSGPRGPRDSDGQAIETRPAGRYELSWARFGEVVVMGTSAPLLPHQLSRLCDPCAGSLVLAIATGNRLSRPDRGEAQTVQAVSEAKLDEILVAARKQLS
ncbi:MAG: hypothetical protein WBG93_09195 [Thermoanaerobaculia bacterium]